MIAARRARLLVLAAGLLAAGGRGRAAAPRPRLRAGASPLDAAACASRWDRRDAVLSFLGAGARRDGRVDRLAPRPGGRLRRARRVPLRARGLPRARVRDAARSGRFSDSFLVRDFLSPRRAAAVFLVAAIGLVALVPQAAPGRRGSARRPRADVPLPLVPPQPRDVALLGPVRPRARARGRRRARGVLRKGPLAFGAALLAAGVFAREAWPDVVASAHEETPPIAAIRDARALGPPGPRDDRRGRGLPLLPQDRALGGPARRVGLHRRGDRARRRARRTSGSCVSRTSRPSPSRRTAATRSGRRGCAAAAWPRRSATGASSSSRCATPRRRSSVPGFGPKESAPGQAVVPVGRARPRASSSRRTRARSAATLSGERPGDAEARRRSP